MRLGLPVLAVCLPAALAANVIGDVRDAVARNDFAAGERIVAEYRKQSGATPEMIEAVSWLGRGALAAKRFDLAERYAAETRSLALAALKTRKLDDERRLPIALGASIEVHAQTLAAQGERSAAVDFLNAELARWGGTSIHERIRKNLNLLTLEGKPAPAIEAERWLGGKAALEGKPVLVFLWAHWCGDCKAMAPAIAAVQRAFAPRGLAVVAPTKLYGYAARGAEVGPEEETRYIDQVRQQFYRAISPMPVPVSSKVFQEWGVSTTPTLALVDAKGIVRLYRPGGMKQEELMRVVEGMLAR